MRILLVNDYAARQLGGAEKYVSSLAALLEEHSHEVMIFGKKEMPGRSVLFTRVYNPVWALRMSRAIREFRPHIVHAHHVSYVLSPSVLSAARRRSVPVVLTIHDSHLFCPRTWLMHANGSPCEHGFGLKCLRCGHALNTYHLYVCGKLLIHRRIISRNADCVISPSEILADWASRNLGIREVQVVPHFIARPIPHPSPVPRSRKIIFVGRFVTEKGAANLIEAMPLILREVPEAKLIMVGDGEQANLLKRLCRELAIDEHVTFTGWKGEEELGQLYEEAQLLCFPSEVIENFGLVLLEAIAHQRPIVASNIGGVPELVRDGETGFLFNPGDPEDLADKVVRLLGDHSLCERMAGNQRKVGDKYSREEHLRRLNEIYESTIRRVST